jgi:hypothetical protein
MRSIRVRLEQSPILASGSGRKHAQNKPFSEGNDRAPELVRVHASHHQRRTMLHQPFIYPSVLQIGGLIGIPIVTISRRIIFL